VWVSRRTDYATRAILALAVADGGPLRLEEIADATGAPRSVLEQVMPTLRTAGVVRSVRGPHGGYRLNHTPEEITLESVVRLFQGQLATISILEDTTFADLAGRARAGKKRAVRT
jgi:Rrf2 family cysteine metabolism transcriptional repressor